MNCKDHIIETTSNELRNILVKERNDFAKSRQQWIQAAFELKYSNDDTLFNRLIEEELCFNCIAKYKNKPA